MLPHVALLSWDFFKGWGTPSPACSGFTCWCTVRLLPLLLVWSIRHPDSFLCTLSLDFEQFHSLTSQCSHVWHPCLWYGSLQNSLPSGLLASVLTHNGSSLNCSWQAHGFSAGSEAVGAMKPLQDGVWHEEVGSCGWIFKSCIHPWFLFFASLHSSVMWAASCYDGWLCYAFSSLTVPYGETMGEDKLHLYSVSVHCFH